jgi:hypothetical protein
VGQGSARAISPALIQEGAQARRRGADRIGVAALAERWRCIRRTTSGISAWRLKAYAHFTSPIRRYPDLLVHRAIKHALGAGEGAASFRYAAHDMAQLSLHCSERADGAPTKPRARSTSAIARHGWRNTSAAEFDGTISGVTSFGLFVELGRVQSQRVGACYPVAQRLSITSTRCARP